MPRYRYKVITNAGARQTGELDASSRQEAIEKLRSAGHLPVRADPIESGRDWIPRLPRPWLKRRQVSSAQLVLLTRELASLLNAGLPLDTALQMLERVEDGPLRELIQSVRSLVQGGQSFSDALDSRSETFNRMYTSMVRAGEASGALHTVMGRLADYLDGMAALRSSIVTTLIYPAILVCVCVASLFALMTFVVPQFIPLFEDAGATLPFLTTVVFGISQVFRDYWWLILALVAIGGGVAARQLADAGTRGRVEARLLELPVLGRLVKAVETARFARTLGALLENGVPLLSGVQLSREVIGNQSLAADMGEVLRSLEQGRGMSQPLRAGGRFPPLAVQLIEVGEETGQLAEMLTRTADIFDREVQTGLKRLLIILEPVLILGLGGIIAIIIMSVLVAILGLNELVA